MPQTIDIPPANDTTIEPAGGEFSFYVTANTTVCFGTPNPSTAFPNLADQTFTWDEGTAHTFPIPAEADASIGYNTSAPGTACSPEGLGDTGRVIIVGQGMGGTVKKSTKKTAGKKASVKAKSTARKSSAKKAAKAKKTAAKSKPKKAAKKVAKKSSVKPARSKSAGKTKTKSKSKTKKSAKKSRR